MLNTLVLALALYPEVQRRAQAELSAIVGEGRFPTFSDRPALPYVEGVYMELLRWRIINPLGA
jgi:cytochrome P450